MTQFKQKGDYYTDGKGFFIHKDRYEEGKRLAEDFWDHLESQLMYESMEKRKTKIEKIANIIDNNPISEKLRQLARNIDKKRKKNE